MRRVGRRLDRLERQLRNGIGVLKVLIGERLHPPSSNAMLFQYVLAHTRHDGDRVVPTDSFQLGVRVPKFST